MVPPKKIKPIRKIKKHDNGSLNKTNNADPG